MEKVGGFGTSGRWSQPKEERECDAYEADCTAGQARKCVADKKRTHDGLGAGTRWLYASRLALNWRFYGSLYDVSTRSTSSMVPPQSGQRQLVLVVFSEAADKGQESCLAFSSGRQSDTC